MSLQEVLGEMIRSLEIPFSGSLQAPFSPPSPPDEPLEGNHIPFFLLCSKLKMEPIRGKQKMYEFQANRLPIFCGTNRIFFCCI